MKITSPFVGLVVAVLAATPVFAQENPTGTWSAEQGGQNFYQGAAASNGTYLYLVGGYQFGVTNTFPQYYQQLRRYDPANNSFVNLAPMPSPRISHAAVYLDDALYAIGGFNPVVGLTNQILRYSIPTNTWVVMSATLAAPRYLLAADALDGRIYVAGGFAALGPSSAMEQFNPQNNTVVTLASMPQAFYYLTLSAVPSVDRLYAISGFSNTPLAVNFEFTPPSPGVPGGSWTARAPLQDANGQSQPRYLASSFVLDDRVYITGGIVSAAMSATWEYNPATDAWARRANMGTGRYWHSGAAVGRKGYVYGGASSLTTGEEFTPPFFNQPPFADAGPDLDFECNGHDGTEVELDGTASFDPDGAELIYFWEGPFGNAEGAQPVVTLPLGDSEIALTVVDPFGEVSSDTVVITVEDTLPPSIQGVVASPDTLWPPNNEMRDVVISVSAADLCDPSPVSLIVEISSNQDEGADLDWEITGALTAQLRAQRSGEAERVYSITIMCVDESGNSSTEVVTVTVPHDQGNE